MTSTINKEKLFEYLRIPVGELEDHPDAKVKLKVYEEKDEVHRWAAQDMLDEVKANNAKGKATSWILPCGPTKHYQYFTTWVNEQKISLKNVYVFHMDDNLDWQGRPLPLDHMFSYEGWMRKNFYDPVDPDLSIPEEQRYFPTIFDIDKISKGIEKLGFVDTTYGGIGFRGHIAFNEPPLVPWYTVTAEEYKESKTRIIHLNDDTIVALSQRAAGGCTHLIPPMVITMGMKDLLFAKRLRFISDTGSWKRTIIRYLLFGEPTVEYPVTLVQDHPDVMVVVDRETVLPPLGG
jgi:glucosamine-6-phosphate deaminase